MTAPNIERRDSGPASQDRTSDEWFEPEDTRSALERRQDEIEAAQEEEERMRWADSMFGVEP